VSSLQFSTCVTLIVLLAANRAGRGEELPTGLILVDGAVVAANSLAVVDERVSGTGVPADLTLNDLQRIAPHDVDDVPFTEVAASVAIKNGGLISAKQVTIANEQAHIDWLDSSKLSVAIDFLRGIRFNLEAASPEYDQSLGAPAAELDRLFITDDEGRVSAVTGLVESLTADELRIDVNGQMRGVSRGKIYGVVFAQPAVQNATPRCVVSFRDRSSRLGGESLSLHNGQAKLQLGPKATVEFPWAAVESVVIRSSRVAYLSDLKPVKEEQTPILTLPLPAQRDKSVSGGRLKVGLESFDKGLGVHARSALTFAPAGKWDLFVAKIGLDARARGKGDCLFQVLADGKSIFQQRITGQDLTTTDIKLPITGCQELTLVVEPGTGLDLADHANWCDARLIKNK
jgi:hypothetical protein